MTCTKLIDLVRRRLRLYRWLNFGISLLFPLSVFLLTVVLLRHSVIPRLLQLPSFGLSLTIFLLLLAKTYHWVHRVSKEEAARKLDDSLQAKERFLTLASVKKEAIDEAASRFLVEPFQAIEKQGQELATNYNLKKEIPLRLERLTQYAVFATSPCVIALVILTFFRSSAAPILRQFQTSEAVQAANLRAIVVDSQTLPTSLKGEILNLADALEREGLLSNEVSEKLDQAIEEVKDLADAEQRRKQAISQAKKNGREHNQEKSKTSSGSQEPEISKDRSAPRESETPSPSSSDLSQQEREVQSSDQQAEQSQTKKETPEQNKELSKQEKSGKNQGPGDERQETLTKQPETGAQNHKQTSEKAEESKDQKKDEQDDPKKDITGVGEGSGQGQSGSKKNQSGGTQGGGDDSRAKDVQGVKNNAAAGGKDDSAGNSSQGSDQLNNQDRSQSAASKQNNQVSKQSKDQNGSLTKNASELQQVEKELQTIQNEIQKQSQGKAGENGKQAGVNTQHQQSTEMNQKQTEQSQDTSKPQDSKAGKGSDPENRDSHQSDTQQASGKETEKKQQDNSQESQESKQGEVPPEQHSQKNEKDQQPEKSSQIPPLQAQGNDQQAALNEQNKSEAGNQSSPGPKPGSEKENFSSKEKSGQGQQQTGDNARRYGSLDGGDGKPISLEDKKLVKIEISPEEKILVRGVGSSDGKRYEHAPGARAKTEIGATEFEKPQPDVAGTSQPIPVEYGDWMR